MENVYGIGITNRYQLFLNEDEDPLEVLKSQEQEKELKKKTKLSEKENKGKQQETKGKPVVTARKGIKETQNIKSQEPQKPKEVENVKPKGPPRPAQDKERKFNNENREERNNQRNRPERAAGPGGDFHREDHREDRGERRSERRPMGSGVDGPEGGRGRPIGGAGRGIGRGRGRGGRGGFEGRRKREYDRQSGSDKTGIKAVDKREGAGAHNWGSHRDDIGDMEMNTNRPAEDSGDWDTKVEADPTTPAEPQVENKEETEGLNGVTEEEAAALEAAAEAERKELTLDEWKALKGTRSKPQYNLRKAGEGEDLTQWKKMYALQKKKEEDDDEDDEEYDSSDYPQRVGRQKHILGIEFTFPDMNRGRGRGGRGAGRGAPRGGAPRGPPRGSSADDGPVPERDSGPYGGPRNPRPIAPKREREPPVYGGGQGGARNSRQSAPKVDDEHDFPSLG